MKKVLVYSHDTYGLGNIRRMLEVSQSLVDSDPDVSVLILSGSPMMHAFRIPARIDYIKLPCLTRTSAGAYAVKFLGVDYPDIVKLRRNIILNAFVDFDPDLVLVDKKPLGISDELLPMLELAKRRAHRTRTALVLRDILDAPEPTIAVWRKNGYHEAIRDFYDQVLVLGSPQVFDTAREYDFPAETRQKVRYCGYVGREPGRGFREELRAQIGVAPDQPLVLVTPGGGEDGERLLRAYLDGWAQDEELKAMGARTLLICGPELGGDRRQRFFMDSSGDSRLIVREFSDDMMTCMDAADVVVCMGGYNTVCELLTLRKRAVVVPRVKPVQEQWIRAERMSGMGLFRALHPAKLQPSHLMREVRGELLSALAGTELPRAAIDMRGLERLQTALGELMPERGSPSGTYPRPMAVMG